MTSRGAGGPSRASRAAGAVFAAVLAAAAALAGCGGPGPADAAGQDVVNVYNWADYIAPDVVPKFEAETGIRVNYDTFDATDTVDVKLLAGSSGYDVVVHTSQKASQLAPVGVLTKLDMAKLPNARHLDPDTLEQIGTYEAVRGYMVPYHYGSTGFVYNADLVRERIGDVPMDTWAIVLEPRFAARLADCGISLLDDATDVIPLALAYLGRDPSAVDDESLAAAEAALRRVRPYIRYFANAKAMVDLPNKEICVAHAWNGDYAQAGRRAEEAGVEIDLRYAVPREGAPLWVDGFYIPSDAPHPDNAYRFIDFMLRPDIAAANAEEVFYANANRSSWELMDPALRNDETVFPGPSTWDRLFVLEVIDPKRLRPRTRAFARIKSGL